MLISQGYRSEADIEEAQRDWQLFSQKIELLLQHQQSILRCSDYFFCHPAFANTSWPYVSGDGPLQLGGLLLGWRGNILIARCLNCDGKVLITSFAGSLGTGSNTWTGLCLCCRQQQKGKHSVAFKAWFDFVFRLRRDYPAALEQHEEYLGEEFSWGGNGLKPAIKRRKISKQLAEPVSLSVLVNELKTGDIRTGNPVNVTLINRVLELKPFSRCLVSCRY